MMVTSRFPFFAVIELSCAPLSYEVSFGNAAPTLDAFFSINLSTSPAELLAFQAEINLPSARRAQQVG
jgi:hypothetical protein